MTLIASESGLEKIDQARKRKGWNKYAEIWCQKANVSVSTLKHFWRRKEQLDDSYFRSICYALGFSDEIIEQEIIDWEISKTIKESLEDININNNLLPFGHKGRIEDPSIFFNRIILLKTLYQNLKLSWNCSLVGDREIGKSSILWKLCQEGYRELGLSKNSFIYLDLQFCDTPDLFLKEFKQKLGIKQNYDLLEMRRYLSNKYFIVCLDEIETLTYFPDDKQRSILSFLRGLAEGNSQNYITIITAGRSPLHQLFDDSPKQPSPLDNICHRISVEPFTKKDMIDFIDYRLQQTNIKFSDEEKEHLFEITQGHPAKLQAEALKLYQIKLNKE